MIINDELVDSTYMQSVQDHFDYLFTLNEIWIQSVLLNINNIWFSQIIVIFIHIQLRLY